MSAVLEELSESEYCTVDEPLFAVIVPSSDSEVGFVDERLSAVLKLLNEGELDAVDQLPVAVANDDVAVASVSPAVVEDTAVNQRLIADVVLLRKCEDGPVDKRLYTTLSCKHDECQNT